MLAERSERSTYLRVLGPLLLAVVTLAVASIEGFYVLSAVRAYVGGESLWSKGRAQTVAKLRARAADPAPAAPCPPVSDWLAMPLGDRAMRLELDKPKPDLAVARAGLLRGATHPDDLDGVIHTYLAFHALPLMREPIAIWAQGDELIEQLRVAGERICAEPAGAERATHLAADLATISRLEADLLGLEIRFSASLGNTSRQAERMLTGLILGLAVLVGVGGTWFVTRTVHEQLNQRRALLVTNTRWELAAESAQLGVYVLNLDNDMVEVDARTREIYGLTATTPIPLGDFLGRMHPEDREGVAQLRRAASAGAGRLSMRHRVVMDDGAVRHIESIGKVRDAVEGGEHLRFAGVVRDVTNEVARAQLQFEKESAQRSALARSEFMSRLSHEMRTPLNAVIGMAQMLQMTPGEPLTSKQDRHAQIILDSGWHLLRLVDDVLDITSIDSGKVAVVPVPTDLNGVMRVSLDMVEPERQRYGVQIAQQWPAEPATVIADPLRLRQVFVNLLSNGCKYNTPGGQLTLGYRDAADEICVIFSDQGAGIPADRLGELFQPFKRLPETAKLPGTGLGLVVVKRLTEQMQGHIDVASEPGHGASFIVWLRKAIPATA